jgi:hypothetical protein
MPLLDSELTGNENGMLKTIQLVPSIVVLMTSKPERDCVPICKSPPDLSF